jgi:hypothetical protein
MDNTVKIALIAAIAAVVSAVVTGLIVPRINWGIEKRKILHAKKQALINDWRALARKIRHEHMAGGEGSTNILEELENQGAFSTLRPHLSEGTLNALDTRDGKKACQILIDEIARLEKKWGLI